MSVGFQRMCFSIAIFGIQGSHVGPSSKPIANNLQRQGPSPPCT